jgi:uncharacterized RDD family membrane protein YckC
MRAYSNHLTIQTPEGIRFRLLLASPLIRMFAWVIDLFVVFTLVSLLGILITLLGYLSGDVALAFGLILYFVVSVGYGILMEWLWRGQTLGKRLLRLRVVDEQGLSLHFHQIVMRNLLRVVDILPGFYLLGGLAVLFSRRCQRLGDYAAATLVVWNPRVAEPDTEQLLAGKYNSLRDHPHLCARLVHKIAPDQRLVALQTILRREMLEAGARLELFQKLAASFKAEVPFPLETTLGMTDEHYVRNVVDVLFRSQK